MKLINRYFIFGLFLVICLLGLQYEFWYGDTGHAKLEALKAENAKLKTDNDKNLLRNQLIEDEVISLRKNDNVIEGIARKDLGLILDGEVYYQFVSPNIIKNQSSDDNENTNQTDQS